MTRSANSVRVCEIVSLTNAHPPIYLPDAVPLRLGRNPLTMVKSQKCSRQQVEVTADYSKFRVELKVLGSHPSVVRGGLARKTDKTFVLVHEDVFKFVEEIGDEHQIVFTPPPATLKGSGTAEKVEEKKESGTSSASKRRSSPPSPPSSAKRTKTRTSEEESRGKTKSSPSEEEVSKPTQFPMEAGPCRDQRTRSSPAEDVRMPVKVLEEGWSEAGDGEVMIYASEAFLTARAKVSKVAGFDLDGTLITTASGKTFPVDRNDWKISFSEVPGKLKALASQASVAIAILSNQRGVSKGKMTKSDLKTKIQGILTRLGLLNSSTPLIFMASIGNGRFRKPCTGMWEHLLAVMGVATPTLGESFYCGDAAGREAGWAPRRKKDFSCSDRLFALNLGLPFLTPEEFFLGQKPTTRFELPTFDPRETLNRTLPLLEPTTADLKKEKQEVIVLVGAPGSGKSHFAATNLKHCLIVNRDTLGTWQKCVAETKAALQKGQSVVVDNTNMDAASRQRYIEIAQARSIPCRCFVMNVTLDHAKHNNRFRDLTCSDHVAVGQMVFNTLKKTYQEPTLAEGFQEIVRVNFVPHFSSEADRKLYGSFLL